MSHCPRCTIDHRPRCPDTRTWPIAPLLDVLSAAQRVNLPDALGVSAGFLSQIEGGGLPDRTADRVAIRLGLHPCMIWPDWFDAALSPLDRDFIADGWRPAWEWNQTHRTEAAA